MTMAKRSRSVSPVDPAVVAEGLPISRPVDAQIEEHAPKYVSLGTGDGPDSAMSCHLPPHKPISFPDYPAYEKHYHQSHQNRCRECASNFPSTRFLELHITENHDPIAASKRDRGEKTYSCFVEGCDKVCADWKKRRSHLVDKHVFPKNYDFFIVDTGVDGRASMLRRGVDAQGHRRSSRNRRESTSTSTTAATQSTAATSEDAGSVEDISKSRHPGLASNDNAQDITQADVSTEDVEALEKSMSALKMVPRSVTFGKRHGKSGFAKC